MVNHVTWSQSEAEPKARRNQRITNLENNTVLSLIQPKHENKVKELVLISYQNYVCLLYPTYMTYIWHKSKCSDTLAFLLLNKYKCNEMLDGVYWFKITQDQRKPLRKNIRRSRGAPRK